MRSDPPSSASLAMERYADGDEGAFVEVYDALAPRLHVYLSRLTRDEAIAEDLLQQSFLKIHDARARFTRGSSVEPWAFSIARRLFIDWARRERYDRRGEPLEGETFASGDPDAEAILSARELSDALHARLLLLPPQQREAFLLVREEGLSVSQAAEVLGTTITAVKLRTHRAYKSLRLALEGADEEGGDS